MKWRVPMMLPACGELRSRKLGNTEVRYFRYVTVADNNVSRLDVTMDELGRVRFREALGDRDHESPGPNP